jgi:hypothetical protein
MEKLEKRKMGKMIVKDVPTGSAGKWGYPYPFSKTEHLFSYRK